MTRRLGLGVALALLVVGTVAVFLAGDDGRADRGRAAPTTPRVPTSTGSPQPPSTSTSAPPRSTTTTTTPPIPWPPPVTDGSVRVVVTPTGVVAAVERRDGDAFVVRSPCGNEVRVAGTPIAGAHVVLDPGHGGDELGAQGPSGLREKDVNLAVAEAARAALERQGASVVLTRTSDYRVTLASRAAIAQALHPLVFVSVHHNAEPDGPSEGPGSEVYFQVASPESRRAAGLLYEELLATFEPLDVAWVADDDAGVKPRVTSRGDDFYGILRRTAGIPAVLSEAAFISNAPEEALLADPAVQVAEGESIASAVVRFVTSADPGSGFIEPYPRTLPAGPGGGRAGCVDPPLS